MASNNLETHFENEVSETTFGNKLSELDFVRRILFEFGIHDEEEMEIDRIITRVKVDIFQEKMEKEYDPDMCPDLVLENK